MRIYLDFDDTILDTGGFKRELERVFREAGCSEEDFLGGYEAAKAKAGGFDLDTILESFARTSGFDAAAARKEAYSMLSHIDAFVHDDFFDFAREFGPDRLALISFGKTAMQRTKIENANIAPHFGEIIVTDRGKEEHFREIVKQHPGKQIFFVDDKAEQVDRVKEVAPDVTAMKMERPGGLHTHTQSRLADHKVRDFAEVANIIRNKR